MNTDTISPSLLPHLAACRCYQPGTGSTEAATRGTKIDKAIRDTWAARKGATLFAESFFSDGLNTKDRAAVEWAISCMEMLEEHHGGAPILTEGPSVQAAPACPGMSGGTMDAVQPATQILLDFKTGQSRDYTAQMAAYAAACMQAHSVDRWTACILYVDHRRTEKHRFTKEEALATVETILNKPETPTPGQHCSWCGNKKCPARARKKS